MTKALFFDIDGTLVSFRSHRVPDSAVRALSAAKDRGVRLFIATGRPSQLITGLGQAASLMDGFVTTNGAWCYCGTEDILFNPVSREDTRTMLDICREEGCPAIFAGTSGIHIVNNNENIRRILGQLFDLEAVRTEASDESILEDTILQASPVLGPDKEKEIMPRLPGCRALRWTDLFMDIVAAGSDKADGISAMCRRFGISHDECMAFGDGGNDISMLRHAGCGVAMGNASPDVKAAADYVTEDVDSDGIAAALRHFGLA